MTIQPAAVLTGTVDVDELDDQVSPRRCQPREHDWEPWYAAPAACDPDGEDLLLRRCSRCGHEQITAASCASLSLLRSAR